MICRPVMMVLYLLWIVISGQEKDWIRKAKESAEQDRMNMDHQMPNEFIQGNAVTARICPPSFILRSAFLLQFWIFYWKLSRERVKLSRTIPFTLTESGQTVPYTAKIIPVLTENINLFKKNNVDMNIKSINLRSLLKEGRYLVINFEAHASDGWKFDHPQFSFIANHQDIKDRLDAVKILMDMGNITEENKIDVYCDTMDDHTNHLFYGWPERLYILYDEKILYHGGEGPHEYSVPSLAYFLKHNI
ncbi:unnamed protein product [Adineta steineri]|uniref:Iodothyronine deiodinase n=1 Tax=Adineta steineri TaxID=433720 RepID=A0A814IC51_9BILA|nr:unnamed protein product [Adineta steineri]